MKRITTAHGIRTARPRRGIALLLVMIGLVVCTILTAGFLSSQGTSIGIVRNERDSEECRGIAQSGVEMCYWLIKNNSGWRESMAPGVWLNNVAVGDGTVTVTASDGDNTGSFSDDPTQSVILKSVGTYDGRSFTLTATITPTGGGTVFRGGNFISGQVSMNSVSVADSYNSYTAAYNSLAPGANNVFWTNSNSSGAISLSGFAYRGSVTVPPNSVGSSVVSSSGSLNTPTATTTSTETRTAGSVVPPNTAGLATQAAFTKTGGSWPLPGPGIYDSITLQAGSPSTNISIPTSGTYYVSNGLTVNSLCKLTVSAGVKAVLYVNGSTSISGTIQLSTGSQLTIYSGSGGFTASSAIINNNGDTSKFIIMGLSNTSLIELKGSTVMYGAIFAPQTAVLLGSSSPSLYGAVIAQSLTIKNSSQFHFDQNLQGLSIDNVTGGSASPGTADYVISVVSSH